MPDARSFFAARAAALAVAAALTFAASAPAAMIDITVAADTYIRSDSSGANQDGDTDNEIIVGRLGDTNFLNGLIRFDLSALAAIESTGQFLRINSVTLTGATRPGAGEGNPITITARDYGFEFVETVSTWVDPDGNGDSVTGDPIDGGTLTGAAVASASFNPTVQNAVIEFDSTAAFVGIVEAALATDATVNLILHRTGGQATGNNFARFQDEDRALPFQLTVDYDLIPTPAALPAGLALMGLTLVRRRRTAR